MQQNERKMKDKKLDLIHPKIKKNKKWWLETKYSMNWIMATYCITVSVLSKTIP